MNLSLILIRSIIDEIIKSHIPYVVHASTRPVLSEPFVPSRASGRTVGRSACAERTVYPSTSSGRTVGRSACAERTVHPEPVEG